MIKIYNKRRPKSSERVYVSQHDINTGFIQDCKRCPIAKALKRRFVGRIEVANNWCSINGIKYHLCEKGVNLILDFDRGRLVNPIHLYIRKMKSGDVSNYV